MHLTVTITVADKEGYSSNTITETTVKVEADSIVDSTIENIAAVAVDRAIRGLENAMDNRSEESPKRTAVGVAAAMAAMPPGPRVPLGVGSADTDPAPF